MRPLRVRYVLGQRLFADALESRLASEGDIVAVSRPEQSGSAVDVVIVHADRRGGLGHRPPEVPSPARLVVLSTGGEAACAAAAARAGASAWLHRSATLEDLLVAVRGVVAGHGYFPRDVHATVLSALRAAGRDASGPGPLDRLTARERQVLDAMADGHGNREIGEVLGVSYNTVRTHTNEIFRKLRVHNRVEAVGLLVGSS